MGQMSKRMSVVINAMQEAIDQLLYTRARLGQKVVVSDHNGKPKVVSAKTLVRQRRAQLSFAKKS